MRWTVCERACEQADGERIRCKAGAKGRKEPSPPGSALVVFVHGFRARGARNARSDTAKRRERGLAWIKRLVSKTRNHKIVRVRGDCGIRTRVSPTLGSDSVHFPAYASSLPARLALVHGCKRDGVKCRVQKSASLPHPVAPFAPIFFDVSQGWGAVLLPSSCQAESMPRAYQGSS